MSKNYGDLSDIRLTDEGQKLVAEYENGEQAIFKVNTMIVEYETTGVRSVAQGNNILRNGAQKEPLTEDLIVDFIQGVRSEIQHNKTLLFEKLYNAGASQYEYMKNDVSFIITIGVDDNRNIEGIFTLESATNS